MEGSTNRNFSIGASESTRVVQLLARSPQPRIPAFVREVYLLYLILGVRGIRLSIICPRGTVQSLWTGTILQTSLEVLIIALF